MLSIKDQRRDREGCRWSFPKALALQLRIPGIIRKYLLSYFAIEIVMRSISDRRDQNHAKGEDHVAYDVLVLRISRRNPCVLCLDRESCVIDHPPEDDSGTPAEIVHIDLDVCELAVRILEATQQRRRPTPSGRDSLITLTVNEREAALRGAHAAVRYFNDMIYAAYRAANKRPRQPPLN